MSAPCTFCSLFQISLIGFRRLFILFSYILSDHEVKLCRPWNVLLAGLTGVVVGGKRVMLRQVCQDYLLKPRERYYYSVATRESKEEKFYLRKGLGRRYIKQVWRHLRIMLQPARKMLWYDYVRGTKVMHLMRSCLSGICIVGKADCCYMPGECCCNIV